MRRVVGLDFGTKRVGLAVSDPLRLFAQPVGTFTPDDAVGQLTRLESEFGIDAIVVGWPLLEDGVEGIAAERVQHYINRIVKKLPGARIVKWDERFSTERARDQLKTGSRPSLRKTGRGRIDTAVAGILLQEYLDETDQHPS
ncbi:MAG: Holliday junction resolvase RuvX [Rhodothermales bacterium]